MSRASLPVATCMLLVSMVTPGSALTFASLRNGTFRCDRQLGYDALRASPLGTVTLKKGKQTLKDQTTLNLNESFSDIGEIDGKPGDDIAAILFQSSTSSLSWRHLLLFVDRNGKPHCLAAVALGNNTWIHELDISGRKTLADISSQGPRDSSYSPRQRQTLVIDAATWAVQRHTNDRGTGLRYGGVIEDLPFEMRADEGEWVGGRADATLLVWGPEEDVRGVSLSLQSNEMPLLKTLFANTVPACATAFERWALTAVTATPANGSVMRRTRRCLARQVVLITWRGSRDKHTAVHATVMSQMERPH